MLLLRHSHVTPQGTHNQKMHLHGILHEQTHFIYILRRLEATLIIEKNKINYTSMTSNKQPVLADSYPSPHPLIIPQK